MKEAVIVGAAGVWRRRLKQIVEEKGYMPVAFIDSFVKGNVDGVPIFTAEDFVERFPNFKGLILMTFSPIGGRKKPYETLRSNLKEATFWDWRKTYSEFREIFLVGRKEGWWWLGEDWDEKEAKEVLKLLADEKSKEIFSRWIEFRKTLDPMLIPEPESEPPYWADGINFWETLPKEFTFLDIGAYVGDIFELALKKADKLNKSLVEYIAIEPSKGAFIRLTERVRNWNKRAILINCGCGKENAIMDVYIDENGMVLTPELYPEVKEKEHISMFVMKIDDMIIGKNVDLIKMDVEGFEMDCLDGLERIIKENIPNIMISIYHRPKDFHTIPVFLKKFSEDYRFAIRVYAYFFMDTVLFASGGRA